MSARDPASSDAFNEIPDPAADLSPPPEPAASAPTSSSWTRSERRRRSLVVIALSIGWVVAVLIKLGVRPDLGALNVTTPILLWVVVAMVSLVAALRPRHGGLPPASPVVQIIAASVPVLFVASALYASRHAEDAPFTLENSAGCIAWAGIAAAGPFALAGFLFERTFLSAPAWRGAAIGVVCGLCAAASIHTHCPMTASAHVVLAHGFPIAAGGLLGALFGALRGRA